MFIVSPKENIVFVKLFDTSFGSNIFTYLLVTLFTKFQFQGTDYFFNIFINDLFFFSEKCEICNFADDNSLYSCGMNLDNIFSNLKQDMKTYMNGWHTIK